MRKKNKAHAEQAMAYMEFRDEYEVFSSFRFDLESGEITDSSLPLTMVGFLDDDIYGYITKDQTTEYSYLLNIKYGDDEVKTYRNAEYFCIPINGYLFINGNDAVNIETGEIRKLKKNAIPQNFMVHTYHNGKYIIMKNDITGREYQTISEEELFED